MTKILQRAIDTLEKVSENESISKNIRSSTKEAHSILSDDDKDIEVRVNSTMQILSNITDDPNVETLTRTQIWGVASLLESIDSQSL